jgi:hypothetical protein
VTGSGSVLVSSSNALTIALIASGPIFVLSIEIVLR